MVPITIGAIAFMRPESYTINLPLKIIYNKKGDVFYLNLNQYRNTHFHILNTVKILFGEMIGPLVRHIPLIRKLDITYILFTGSKRSVDLANICSIVDKFFCDTLVNNNVLIDDGIDIISNIEYKYSSIDKENPRVEAILSNIEFEEPEKEEPMRITLVEAEIKEALKNYVGNHINLTAGQNVNIELRAGRGEDGFTADLEVVASPLVPAVNQVLNQTYDTSEPDVKDIGPATKADVPFDVDAPQTAIQAENAAQAVTQPLTSVVKPLVAETPTQAPSNALGAPTSSTPAKSLFANLTKPVHDPKPE